MSNEKSTRQNRLREALGRVYDQYPPYFQEHLRQFREDPKSRVFAPLADGYRKMGQIEEAIAVCLDGLKHHPDFPSGRVVLAKCYVEKQRFAEAREQLERVVQVAPENLLAQKLLGEVHLATDNRVGALHCYRMALLLAPQDLELTEKVKSLEASPPGGAYRDENRVKEAVRSEVVPPAIKESAPAVVASPVTDTWEEMALPSTEEDPEDDPDRTAQIDAILGAEGSDEITEQESFQIAPVSSLFRSTPVAESPREITTETLGDLYFAQGQFEKSLRIYEKLAASGRTSDLQKKMNRCRASLGVDPDSLLRKRKLELLRGILKSLNP